MVEKEVREKTNETDGRNWCDIRQGMVKGENERNASQLL